jgi:hypothetical protein
MNSDTRDRDAGRPQPGRIPALPNGAVARLTLVRALRALGLDLPTIRKVVGREISLPRVAAAPTEARDVRTWTLRLQRSLPTVARHGSTAQSRSPRRPTNSLRLSSCRRPGNQTASRAPARAGRRQTSPRHH